MQRNLSMTDYQTAIEARDSNWSLENLFLKNNSWLWNIFISYADQSPEQKVEVQGIRDNGEDKG